jgi:hypothetical protein
VASGRREVGPDFEASAALAPARVRRATPWRGPAGLNVLLSAGLNT